MERGFLVDEAMTSESSIISYNNFYEFSTDKNAVAEAAKDFDTTGGRFGSRGGSQAKDFYDSGSQTGWPDRRTHLSHALRGSVVDGDTLGWATAVASS